MDITKKIDSYLNEKKLPPMPNIGEQIEVYSDGWSQEEDVDIVSISKFPVYIGIRENGDKVYITYNSKKNRWEEK